MIYNDLLSGKKKMAVIGLGYVGLPLPWSLQRKFLSSGLTSNPIGWR